MKPARQRRIRKPAGLWKPRTVQWIAKPCFLDKAGLEYRSDVMPDDEKDCALFHQRASDFFTRMLNTKVSRHEYTVTEIKKRKS